MINDILGIELAYINTAHPDFIGTKGAINNITESIVDEKVKERESQIIAEHEAKKALQNQKDNPKQGKDKKLNTNYTAISKETQNLNNLDWTGYLTNKDSRQKKKKKRKTKTTPPSLDSVPRIIRQEENFSEREEFEIKLIKQLLISYFNLVRMNILDIIPKCIMFYLVNHSKVEMQSNIVTKLYKEEFLDELLSETTEIVTRRKRIRLKLKTLKQAKEILNEVKDTHL